ncbi:MAG: hypothetical protein LW832_05700 [Parachlamydia sp.]|jgi:hypothetical protein|nr:hypothetical protein [Parachlamydia sp.]
MSHHYFIKSFVCTVLVLASLVLIINWGIDPYGILETPTREGINSEKPQAEHHQRLVQAVNLIKQRPHILFMGSSRTRAGLLPEQIVPYLGREGYNLGLAAVTVEELHAYLQHAYTLQPALKEVIIDLDPFMFNRNRKINVQFDPKRLNQDKIIWDDYVGALFTYDSLVNSLATIKHNASKQFFPPLSQPPYQSLNPDDWHFLRDISIAHAWFGKYEVDPLQVEHYKGIVQFCKERNIGLKMYFSPAQAYYWEVIFAKNLWPVFEQLKTRLAGIHPFMDFSGYNEMTTCGSFYTDCSHYTPAAGEIILARLYASPEEQGLGFLMTADKVEGHLVKIQEERRQWLESNQEVSSRIHQLIR